MFTDFRILCYNVYYDSRWLVSYSQRSGVMFMTVFEALSLMIMFASFIILMLTYLK